MSPLLLILILLLLFNRAVRAEIEQEAKPRIVKGDSADAIRADLYMLDTRLQPRARKRCSLVIDDGYS